MLPCGHPDECEADECCDDCGPACKWCEDIEYYKGEAARLENVIHDKAVIVNGGQVEIIDGNVG